jgi:hypothetical protein
MGRSPHSGRVVSILAMPDRGESSIVAHNELQPVSAG